MIETKAPAQLGGAFVIPATNPMRLFALSRYARRRA